MSADPMLALAAAAATFLVHSTVLILTVRAIARRLGPRRRGEEELLWRGALLGALLTTAAQCCLGSSSSWVLPLADPPARASSPDAAATRAAEIEEVWTLQASPPAAAPVTTPLARPRSLDPSAPSRRTESVVAKPERSREPAPEPERSAWGLGLGLWALGSAIAGWSLLAGCWRGRRRARRFLRFGSLVEELERLRVAAGLRRPVRLSVSDRLEVPVVYGLWRPEIGLPSRALRELDDLQLRCVLAHEVAHLRRGDAWWSWIRALVCSLFYFQPLLRLVTRRLRELAELDCDEWAAQRVGDRLAVADTLTEVAGWLPTARRVPALAMARSRSGLHRRVDALLGTGGPPSPTRARRGVVAVLLLLGLVALVPGFAPPARATTTEREADRLAAPPRSGHRAPPKSNIDDILGATLAAVLDELEALSGELSALRRELEDDGLTRDDRRTLHSLESREAALRRVADRLAAGLAHRSSLRHGRRAPGSFPQENE